MGQRSKWLGWSGGIKRRVALSCDAAGLGARRFLVPTTLRQFSRDRPTMGSHVAGDSRGGDLDVGGPDVGGSDVGGPDLGDRDKERRLLETNFWDSEDSEDEGIGSDDSVEHADMSPVQESPVKSLNWAVDKRKVSGRRRRGVGGILTQIRKSFQGKAEQGGLVFGVGLGELVTSEGGKVPQLVTWATELIEQRGAEACEGIYRLSFGIKQIENYENPQNYRLSGQSSTVASLRAAIDAGKQPSDAHTASTHSVAAMLKVCLSAHHCLLLLTTFLAAFLSGAS